MRRRTAQPFVRTNISSVSPRESAALSLSVFTSFKALMSMSLRTCVLGAECVGERPAHPEAPPPSCWPCGSGALASRACPPVSPSHGFGLVLCLLGLPALGLGAGFAGQTG